MIVVLAKQNGTLREELYAQAPQPRVGQWVNFLRNLDELDLERLADDERKDVYDTFAPEPDMRV